MTKSTTKSLLKGALLLSVGASTLAISTAAMAQDATGDEIIVTGTRQVIQDALKLKRQATTVVDGLSADEIGDLPALSIAEALEQITSVGSQREGSGATEVSIRGLGPFLGSTVINGREATNGGGDRSVNFSQFPSELFNKIEVFKTQEASFIEGGVAGQIALSTLKPLEYGKRRIQLQAKGSVQPDNLNIDNPERGVGYRLTGSYVDQWENSKFGEFGLSVGGQIQRRSNSEQEARSSSTFDACRVPSLDGNSCDDFETFRTFVEDEFDISDGDAQPVIRGITADEDNLDSFTDQELFEAFFDAPSFNNNSSGNETFGQAFITDADVQDARIIDPSTGVPFGVNEDIVLTTSNRELRQNITDDERDSFFAATQWRPNDRLEINADFQYADRTFSEIRNIAQFEANDIEPLGDSSVIPGFELVTASDGSLRRATTTGVVQAILQETERSEEYIGFGGNIAYEFTDRLRASIDGSYSDTSRVEEQFRVRLATQSRDIGLEILQDGSQAFEVSIENTNILDTALFTGDEVEIQEELNQFRNNTIQAIRGDVEYDVDNGFLTTFKAGARFSRLEYDQLPRVRNETELDDAGGFFDGGFVDSLGGETIVGTIELDVSTGDEEDLAEALGFLDLFNIADVRDDLEDDAFEGETGFVPGFTDETGTFIPGSTATFVVDNNGDIDITATPDEFIRLGFLNDNDTDELNEGSNLGVLAAEACAASSFPESSFLTGETNGPIITNIQSDGVTVNPEGTGNEFLTFTSLDCLSNALIGRQLTAPGADDATGVELVQSVDVEEDTTAIYGQFDFETTFDGLPVRGNFGLRYVDTTLTSRGFRADLDVEVNEDGVITGVATTTSSVTPTVDEFSYDEFLPSVNLVVDVNDDVLLRGGIFRALSRPDPNDLGSGRSFQVLNLTEENEDATVQDFVGNVIANGNPRLEPFTSWNYDLAAEWYPNADSILGIGAYYKVFKGGFQNSLVQESVEINGDDVPFTVPVLTTTDETNTIFGVELNAAHAFTYLPGVFSGLGFKASYNYAESNFEFEDGQFGEAVTLEGGDVISVQPGFVTPANLPGLSKHTANGQIYWGIGKATLTGIGKFRSDYFQPGITTPLNLRFIDDAFVADARFSYKLNDNIKVSLEGTNLLNTAREQFNPTLDSFAEINVFGPRFFAGVTAKF